MVEPAPKTPLLERLGVRYFRTLSDAHGPAQPMDEVHVLNPTERAALRSVQRRAILRACIAGALSTVVSGGAEALVTPLFGHDEATFEQKAAFWGVVAGATIIASTIEILFLYWDGLRSVHALAHAAGLELFPPSATPAEERTAVARAMARAALELPNPSDALFGVDPRREASKLGLLFASIVYKAKVSVSNFLAKMLVRRMLGRALVRAWLPFVAVPITAAWNGVVCWLILREARIRAMGPSAAIELVSIVFEDAGALGDVARAAVVRAVAASIVRTVDLHPNLVALLVEVRARVEHEALSARGVERLDDPKEFLRVLHDLEPREQRLVLRVLSIAAAIDGRLTRAEKRLLEEARAACGLDPSVRGTERLRRAFTSGDPISREVVLALA